jgi:hypothetical protein
MLDMLKAGGNAVDAAMAGAITQATVQLDMTNHTGTVSFIYWEAKTGQTYQLNSMGTLVPHLPPFRTYPEGMSGLAAGAPMACIPGFMPGVAAIHAKFGTKPWKALVEPAIPWAENGHRMDEFTRAVLEYELEGNTFFPSMRELYAPDGFTPSVGELWKNPPLARTLRRLADEGPEYFTRGEWAQHFVATANQLGWGIRLADMTATAPRWQDPMRWKYKEYEIVHEPRALHGIGRFALLLRTSHAPGRVRARIAPRPRTVRRSEGRLDVRRLSRAHRDHTQDRPAEARRRSHAARGVHVSEGKSAGVRLVDWRAGRRAATTGRKLRAHLRGCRRQLGADDGHASVRRHSGHRGGRRADVR